MTGTITSWITRVSRLASTVVLILLPLASVACREHPHSASTDSAEPILLHASAGCLARIVRLVEVDDRPADGDYRVEAWLQPQLASGDIPEVIRLQISPGYVADPEAEQRRIDGLKLGHDSLKQGELHWFIFSADYDSSSFPYQIAAWYPWKDGTVPLGVIDAIRQNRFADHPLWDKESNTVLSYRQHSDRYEISIRKGDDLSPEGILFHKERSGKLQHASISHWPIAYEMDWPAENDATFVYVQSRAALDNQNEFSLPADFYRINLCYEMESGSLVAIWIAADREAWILHAFRQYSPFDGSVEADMRFEFMQQGGIAAGGETEQWYRRTVRRFTDSDDVSPSPEIYRHGIITTGEEHVFSGSGWIRVDKDANQGNE